MEQLSSPSAPSLPSVLTGGAWVLVFHREGSRVYTTRFTCACEYVCTDGDQLCVSLHRPLLFFFYFLAQVSLCGPTWPGLELTTKLRLILSSEVYLPLPPEARDSSCALPRPRPRPRPCFSRWNLPPRVSRVDQADWQRPRGLPVSVSPA